MGGVIAFLPTTVPTRAVDVSSLISELQAMRLPGTSAQHHHSIAALRLVHKKLTAAHRTLGAPDAEHQLLTDAGLVTRAHCALDSLEQAVHRARDHGEAHTDGFTAGPRNRIQREMIRIEAALWDLQNDRFGRLKAISSLLDTNDRESPPPPSAVRAYSAIETTLRGIDRIEERSTDSAALHIWVRGPNLGRLLQSAREDILPRTRTPRRRDVVIPTRHGLAFAYRLASTDSRPGENVRALRPLITDDALLRRALHTPDATVTVLGTSTSRGHGALGWVNSPPGFSGRGAPPDHYAAAVYTNDADVPYAVSVLGRGKTRPDVRLTAAEIPRFLVTETEHPAKLVPTFCDIVSACPGSFMMIIHSGLQPDMLLLAVRGDVSRLHVGLTPGGWLISSEPYGLIGDAERSLRLTGTDGSVVTLRTDRPVDVSGIERYFLNHTRRPVTVNEVVGPMLRSSSADK